MWSRVVRLEILFYIRLVCFPPLSLALQWSLGLHNEKPQYQPIAASLYSHTFLKPDRGLIENFVVEGEASGLL